MATITPTVTVFDDKTFLAKWEGCGNGDVGAPVELGRFADKTVHVFGTFGAGGDVDIQGSNDEAVASGSWGQCHDPTGTAISIGDTNPLVVAENPLNIRPSVSGDGTTDLTVVIFGAMRSD